MDPHLRMRGENQGALIDLWQETQCSSRVGTRYLRELLELHKSVPFEFPRGNVGFLSRLCSGKTPHFALMGESLVFS